jgi:hypothetical protein
MIEVYAIRHKKTGLFWDTWGETFTPLREGGDNLYFHESDARHATEDCTECDASRPAPVEIVRFELIELGVVR